jgi:hypothetical protein
MLKVCALVVNMMKLGAEGARLNRGVGFCSGDLRLVVVQEFEQEVIEAFSVSYVWGVAVARENL